MSIFFAALALLFVAQPGLSRPEQSSMPDVQQVFSEIQTTVDKAVSEIKKSLNIPENPDGASIVKAIHEQSDKAEKVLKDMRTKIEETIEKNPELSGPIAGLKQKISEAEANLKKDNPEVAANARKGVDALKQAYDSVGREIQRMQSEVNKKGGLREDLDGLLKNLIDRGTAAAKELKSNFEQVVQQSKKN